MAGRKKENDKVYAKRIDDVKKRTIYIKKKIEDLYTVYAVKDDVVINELKDLKKFIDGCIIGMHYTVKEASKNDRVNGRRLKS
tara:strand:+ start:299 stop:547 length:249 start_codon:yes stop_codon:yes gene_type:complete